MTDDQARLELSMAAEPISVRLLRAEVLRWLREQRLREEPLTSSVALATSEAVANVVRHAYESAGGRVELDARMDSEWVTIEVSDHGNGLALRRRGEGGIGLPLISQVADSVAMYSNDEGTTLAMRFALEHEGATRRQSQADQGGPAPSIQLH